MPEQLFEFEPSNYTVRLKKLGLYYAFATAFYTGGANTKDIEFHLYCSKSTSNWIKEATYLDSGISSTLHVSSIIRNDDVDNNIGIFATAACWNGNYGNVLGSGNYTKLEIAYLGQYLDEITE